MGISWTLKRSQNPLPVGSKASSDLILFKKFSFDTKNTAQSVCKQWVHLYFLSFIGHLPIIFPPPHSYFSHFCLKMLSFLHMCAYTMPYKFFHDGIFCILYIQIIAITVIYSFILFYL